MADFSPAFRALLKEAQFTNEMLGAGATQIRKANYATKGIYFQAFTSLATGLERIGKLTLIVDHHIASQGGFPDYGELKRDIGHKLRLLWERSRDVASNRNIVIADTANLEDPIRQSILTILHAFAEGDRYCNINLVTGRPSTRDPVAEWLRKVDVPLYNTRVRASRRVVVARNARIIAEVMGQFTFVQHSTEDDQDLSDLYEASQRTGMFESVAPYRQLYVLQIIRYWARLLTELTTLAHAQGSHDIPYFSEIFGAFLADDTYFRSRKTWTSA